MDLKKKILVSIISLLVVSLISSCVPDIATKQEETEILGGENDFDYEVAEKTPEEEPQEEEKTAETIQEITEADLDDAEVQRQYFLKGVENFQQEKYLEAHAYLSRIEDSYLILQDYIYYYLARGLYKQGYYPASQKYYALLLEEHPTSIWVERANREYADIHFQQEDYQKAAELYSRFYDNYPESDYGPYTLFQLAVCQDQQGDIEEAYSNYINIWLDYPTTDFASSAYNNLERLIEENDMEAFVPTADQAFDRAMIFFYDRQYKTALSQLNHILKQYDISSLMEANVFFRMGMSNYNMREYGLARDFLLSAYEVAEGRGVADDALYFLARAETNLGRSSQALDYYQQLLDKYPQSSRRDDTLYRMGRIYYFDDELDKAIEMFCRMVDQYSGGQTENLLWELGWLYYNNDDFHRAEDIFENLALTFRGTEIGEKGLFWQAKSLEKRGQDEDAIKLLERIVAQNSYSFYTFSAQQVLEEKGIEAEIPPLDRTASLLNPQIIDVVPMVFNALEDESANDNNIPLHIRKAVELLKIELFETASSEVEAGRDAFGNDPYSILMLSTFFYQSHDYRNSISMLTRNRSSFASGMESPYKDYYYYLLFPYAFLDMVEEYGEQYDVDPLFVLAIMRQESRFQSHVSSWAGARGLMQVMPATGREIAGQMGLAGFNIDQLFDAEQSIMMGSYYLRQQLNRFDGNMYFASAAYNAGPGSMQRWQARWGDKDIYEFIENIPFDETRDYVKKVMGNYYVYKLLYG